MAQSPLNYTGGKFKLLPQILPLFPKRINTFVDLFCGGGDVGANVACGRVLFNDSDRNVIGILRTFKRLSKSRIQRFIFDTIARYDLSLSGEHGYQYYLCDSQNGLGAYNREPYLRLRDYFNHLQRKDYRYYLTLYVLIVYSFNNQIRFNQDGWFNLPVGKRDFNNRMQDKLSSFIDRLHEMDCQFTHRDFRNFETAMLNENDFVYADPPYLITCATYNEQDGWNEDLEVALYDYLDNLHRHHIRFALSNVLSGKGKENTILHEWLLNNPQYICHHLNYKYNNSNYHIIDRNAETDEVLVVNY